MITQILKKITQIIIISLLVLGMGEASARTESLQLKVNELKVFSVYQLKRVAVGDPAIADVSVLSEGEVMLIAKKTGTTSLIIWDESGQRSYNIIVIERDLGKIAQQIRGLLAASDITGLRLRTEEDNIYIIGEVLNERELDKVKDILAPFASVVNLVTIKERQPLVEIDVEVLELSYTDEKDLGMDWSSLLPVTYTEPSSSGPRTPGSPYDPKTHTTGKAPKLWRVLKWDRSTVDAKLNFLIQEDRARTLANPKLVTLSGKEASFLVGGEVPYVTVETEGRTNVEWREYGINLKIKPEVNTKNEIRTSIKAEVSDLDWANAATQQDSEIPALKKREAQTELFLNDGDTIFIAGLIKSEDSRDVERLPWLSNIPMLGELFKSSEFKDKSTELVISITPRIIGEKPGPEYFTQEMLREEAIFSAQRRLGAYSEESSPIIYYTHMIEDIITRNAIYPEEARHAQEEGIVQLDIFLLSDGQLKEIRIKQSSGFRALDEAALAAVHKQAPYPSFPSQMTQREIRLTVPVVFKSYVKNE